MQKRYKSLLIFLIGTFFGLAVFLIYIFLEPQFIPQTISRILLSPGYIGNFLSSLILWPICHFDTTNICRGLGLDGGPLEWVEWTMLIGSMCVSYGIVFLLVHNVYKKFTK